MTTRLTYKTVFSINVWSRWGIFSVKISSFSPKFDLFGRILTKIDLRRLKIVSWGDFELTLGANDEKIAQIEIIIKQTESLLGLNFRVHNFHSRIFPGIIREFSGNFPGNSLTIMRQILDISSFRLFSADLRNANILVGCCTSSLLFLWHYLAYLEQP